MSQQPRRVTLFALGGTIAMTAGPDGSVVPALSATELITAVPGLAESGVTVTVNDFRRLPGASLTMKDLHELAGAIQAAMDGGEADGVVVTAGTDPLEEVAYALDLWHAGRGPIVVTGAMRNPTQPGHDGPANLLAAVTVAAEERCRGLGALLVSNDEIHCARRVRKVHSTNVSTFQSPDGGPLGYLVAGKPCILNTPGPRWSLPPAAGNDPDVGLYTTSLSDKATMLNAAHLLDGLVVAGFGVGHVPHWIVDRLEELALSIPVVLTSRTGSGPVLTDTYGFAGSERDLVSRGLVPAGLLHPYKARILLHTLLTHKAPIEQIREAFDHAGGVQETKTPGAGRGRVQFPLVQCAHRASPHEEMTPDRVAEILLEEEADAASGA